jgi:hypothetical protein
LREGRLSGPWQTAECDEHGAPSCFK